MYYDLGHIGGYNCSRNLFHGMFNTFELSNGFSTVMKIYYFYAPSGSDLYLCLGHIYLFIFSIGWRFCFFL